MNTSFKTTWAISILSCRPSRVTLLSDLSAGMTRPSARQLTLNSLSPPRLRPSGHSVSLYSEFCRAGGWAAAESDKKLSRTDPCPIPGKWHDDIWYLKSFWNIKPLWKPRSPPCRTWDRRTRPSRGRGPPCWGWRTGWGSPSASWWSCSRAAPGKPAGTDPARCPHTCEERIRYFLSFLSEVILWNWQFNLEDNSIYLLQREKIKSQEEINSPGFGMISFTIEIILIVSYYLVMRYLWVLSSGSLVWMRT